MMDALGQSCLGDSRPLFLGMRSIQPALSFNVTENVWIPHNIANRSVERIYRVQMDRRTSGGPTSIHSVADPVRIDVENGTDKLLLSMAGMGISSHLQQRDVRVMVQSPGSRGIAGSVLPAQRLKRTQILRNLTVSL